MDEYKALLEAIEVQMDNCDTWCRLAMERQTQLEEWQVRAESWHQRWQWTWLSLMVVTLWAVVATVCLVTWSWS